MWKILSDGNWVMMPNVCEKLSDEWWKLSDKKNEAKQPLSFWKSEYRKKKNIYIYTCKFENL